MDKKQSKLSITIKDLLESGAHFGHQKHRWNPKMKRFIFKEEGGIYIIDLAKTLQQVREAKRVVEEVTAKRKPILFVGTKKAAKAVLPKCAEDAGEPYVNERWLGGMLTNLTTIRKSVKKLELVEARIAAGGEGLTKKEMSLLTKQQQKLEKSLSGIRTMRKLPGLVIVVDPSKEHIAVAEAKKLGIPVLGLVDTNCDPDPIDHVIACNDDALKCIKLILDELASGIVQKKNELFAGVAKEGEEKFSSKAASKEGEDKE